MTITHIALASRSNQPIRGYKLEGEERCLRTLQAGERCWFKAVASRFGRSKIGDLRITAAGEAVR